MEKSKVVSLRMEIPVYTKYLNNAYQNEKTLSSYIAEELNKAEKLEVEVEELSHIINEEREINTDNTRELERLTNTVKTLEKDLKKKPKTVVEKVEVIKEVPIEIYKDKIIEVSNSKELKDLKARNSDLLNLKRELDKEIETLENRILEANKYIKDNMLFSKKQF